MATIDLQKRTAFMLRDLHAREQMRLAWYRGLLLRTEALRQVRARKARHIAFIRDLLRRRGLSPARYAGLMYGLGLGLGLLTAALPAAAQHRLSGVLEHWLYLRYRRYHRALALDASLRSMLESLRLRPFAHPDPAPEVIALVADFEAAQAVGA